MFNSGTVKAVIEDLWQFVRNGCHSDTKTQVLEDRIAFIPGEAYQDNSLKTALVRLQLSKEYTASDLNRPLLPSEYTSYFLQSHGVELPSASKHWSPGTWHEKLRGQAGVHVSIVPTTGSVMEYRDENNRAVTVVVHEIGDDETIRFGAVGIYEHGVYEELVVPREVWQEFRPVFISFSSHE